jgi:hypothetical protein
MTINGAYKGWTTFKLEHIEPHLMKEALDAAYENATSKAFFKTPERKR